MPDHDHLVTTDQLNAAVGEVRVEIANLDKQLTGELAELRTEVRTGFANVNTAIAKLAEQHARTETHRLRWTLGAIVTGVRARRHDPAPPGRLKKPRHFAVGTTNANPMRTTRVEHAHEASSTRTGASAARTTPGTESAGAPRAKLLPELLTAIREASSGEPIDRHWVQLALQYFHDVPTRTAKNVQDGKIASDAEGMTVDIEGRDYWIPWPHAAGLSQGQRRHLPVRSPQRPFPENQ